MAELKLNAALGAALPIFEVITTSAITTLIHSNRRPFYGRRRCRHPLPLPLPTPIPTPPQPQPPPQIEASSIEALLDGAEVDEEPDFNYTAFKDAVAKTTADDLEALGTPHKPPCLHELRPNPPTQPAPATDLVANPFPPRPALLTSSPPLLSR